MQAKHQCAQNKNKSFFLKRTQDHQSYSHFLWKQLLNWGFLLLDDSNLRQVDIELDSTHISPLPVSLLSSWFTKGIYYDLLCFIMQFQSQIIFGWLWGTQFDTPKRDETANVARAPDRPVDHNQWTPSFPRVFFMYKCCSLQATLQGPPRSLRKPCQITEPQTDVWDSTILWSIWDKTQLEVLIECWLALKKIISFYMFIFIKWTVSH